MPNIRDVRREIALLSPRSWMLMSLKQGQIHDPWRKLFDFRRTKWPIKGPREHEFTRWYNTLFFKTLEPLVMFSNIQIWHCVSRWSVSTGNFSWQVGPKSPDCMQWVVSNKSPSQISQLTHQLALNTACHLCFYMLMKFVALTDFLVVVLAIASGITSASIAIFICTFACRRFRTARKVIKTSNTRSESEPILGLSPDGDSTVLVPNETNKGDVSPCPSCRKMSTFYNPCECDMVSSQNIDRKPCQVQFSLFYNFHDSHLFINIMCALNVQRRWYGKYPPTQVRFQLLPDDSNVYHTEIKSNTGTPIFNETFEFIGYSENELRELVLRLGLYAFDKFSRGKMIGYTDVYFNMEKFQPSEPTIIWRDLLPNSQVWYFPFFFKWIRCL